MLCACQAMHATSWSVSALSVFDCDSGRGRSLKCVCNQLEQTERGDQPKVHWSRRKLQVEQSLQVWTCPAVMIKALTAAT